MVLGEPLAAGASCEPALVCRSWLVPTRVVNSFAQALIRSDAVRYTRLVGSFGLPYRPCRLGPATPILCWLAPVVAVLRLHIRMLDSCGQELARSAAVCGEHSLRHTPFLV